MDSLAQIDTFARGVTNALMLFNFDYLNQVLGKIFET